MQIDKIRIGVIDIPIAFMPPGVGEDIDAFGTFCGAEGIEIAPDQNPATMASTVMHECLHAIHHVYHLPKNLKEERMCETLEGPIVALICDNPALIAAIIGATKRGEPMQFPQAQD